MLKPKKNTLVHTFFCWYIARIIKKNFNDFKYNAINLQPDKAIFLIANHYSWWDGFLIFHLNNIYFKKRFYVMIMENTAKTIWFMRYLGAFSLQPNSRSMLQSLQYAGSLLDNSENLVLVFPQGKLHSTHIDKIEFQKGLQKIVEFSKKQFQYVFSVSLTDYFENKKPTIYTTLQTNDASNINTLVELENSYNLLYQAAKKKQTETII